MHRQNEIVLDLLMGLSIRVAPFFPASKVAREKVAGALLENGDPIIE